MRIVFAIVGLAVLGLGIAMVRRPEEVSDVELRVNKRLPTFYRFRPDLKPPDVYGWILILFATFDLFVTVVQPFVARR
ncbi:MAG: hypothetical protein ACRDH7_06130 [Actinomycetota bacterium]